MFETSSIQNVIS